MAKKKGRDPRPMDDEKVQATLAGMLQGAQSFVESNLSPAREAAMKYYRGDPFGNEEPGRSQVVLTEVRDGILGVLPNLLRVFFSADKAVEFIARSAQKQQEAEQATDYVDHVFMNENAGFLQTHAVLKDGLRGRMGVFKWGWDDSERITAHKLDGVSEEQLAALLEEPGISLGAAVEVGEGILDVEIERVRDGGKAWISAVPPEEFWFTPEARSVDDAMCLAHAREMSRSDLIALGYDPEIIDEHGGKSSRLSDSPEQLARHEDDAAGRQDPNGGKANDKILYVEAYPYLDVDGDGIAELRQICTIGEQYFPVKNTRVNSRPFSVFIPDPEPHTLDGQSWADRLMDLQKSKSSILRATLDSLALAIYPRITAVDGQVNIEDVLNTAIGAPIRQNAPGMVGTIAQDFVGREGLTVLQFLEGVQEARTGQNKGTIGLDADALQSSTKDAVGAAIGAAQAQTEMLARIFAETTLKPLFKGVLELLVAHQPRAEVMRLRGRWVEIDPRTWDADMGVKVNVALGTSMTETKLAALEKILAKQEQVMSLLGPDNMLVSLVEYRAALDYAVRLLGFADSSMFFKPVDAQQLQAALAQQSEAKAQEPTPEQVIAQAQLEIERMKAERDFAIKHAELEMKEKELQLKAVELQLKERESAEKLELEREKLAAEIAIEREKLVLEAEQEALANEQKAQLERERLDAELEAERERFGLEQAKAAQDLAIKEQEHAMSIEQQREQHSLKLTQDRESHLQKAGHEEQKARREDEFARAEAARKEETAKKPRKARITKEGEGFKIEESD